MTVENVRVSITVHFVTFSYQTMDQNKKQSDNECLREVLPGNGTINQSIR